MINRVFNIDCLRYMRRCKDNKFDLAIVDPPYGIGDFNQGPTLNKPGNIKYEITWNEKIPEKKYFNELFRISKNQIIWGVNYYRKYINFGGTIIWDKGNKSGIGSDCEIAGINKINKVVKWFYQYTGFCRNDNDKKIHPCQKPIALYKWLLKNYAKPGDRIFDSHVGSGSSRIACYKLGFDFIGAELDLDYWNAQEERFKFAKAKIDDRFIYDKKDTLFDDINN
jgi:site-specific DNA-methyltransferase (adenine-specific)